MMLDCRLSASSRFRSQLIIALTLVICTIVDCKTECVRAHGRLICATKPSSVANILVELKDHDGLPLEIDDVMGRTWSTSNGSFDLSGCGNDIGLLSLYFVQSKQMTPFLCPWNKPDPYLKIVHSCPPSDQPHQTETVQRTTEIYIWPTFLPKVADVGRIHLDEPDPPRLD